MSDQRQKPVAPILETEQGSDYFVPLNVMTRPILLPRKERNLFPPYRLEKHSNCNQMCSDEARLFPKTFSSIHIELLFIVGHFIKIHIFITKLVKIWAQRATE